MSKETTLRIETGHIEELIRKEIDRVYNEVKAAATTYQEAFKLVDELLEDSDGGLSALLHSRIHDYVRSRFEREYIEAPIPKETPAATEVSNRKCTHDQFARGEHLLAKELGRESNSKLRS